MVVEVTIIKNNCDTKYVLPQVIIFHRNYKIYFYHIVHMIVTLLTKLFI